MRIKYVTNVRIPTPRAQGYAIMKMCSEFAQAGHEVSLFVPSRRTYYGDKPFVFYGIKESFGINSIKSTDFLGKTMRFGKLFYWIDTVSFLISARLNIRINSDDVLYTRDFMILLAFPSYKKSVFEVHDIPSKKGLFRMAIKRVSVFVVLNSNLKQELVSMGIADNRIFVSPSGVDIEEFDIDLSEGDARGKTNLPMEKKIVVYTGHLYKWKGVDTLAEVAGLMPDVLFVFVGGVIPEIDTFVSKYKKYKNIIVRPFAERSVVPTYLKSADVLVVPNSSKDRISSHYTSPLKLLEYMASKRPIVASDLPSIKEVVTTNDCVFAEPENRHDFADKINGLLNNPELAEKISQSAFDKVQKYSWQNRAKSILSFIDTNK